MGPVEKLNDILHAKTRDAFHDGSLLSVLIMLEDSVLEFKIEHMREDDNINENNIISYLKFTDFGDLNITGIGGIFSGVENKYSLNDEITSFDGRERADGGSVFRVTGSCGWMIEFTARNLEYRETAIQPV